jgi:hypothetical protein
MSTMNWAHVHLMVNELPIVGSAFAFVLLAVASVSPGRDAWGRAGSLVLAIAIFGVVAAFFSGGPAIDVITGSPRSSAKALSEHHVRALVACGFSTVAAAAVIGAAVSTRRRRGSYSRQAIIMVMLAALAMAGTLVWTGQAGGRINHPELQGPLDREDGPAHPH